MRRLPARNLMRLSATLVLAAGVAACGERTDEPPADYTAAAGDTAVAAADTAATGFDTPESVLHDQTGDVYLVSNINGSPLDKDDNGYIARVRPDGSIEQLRWIDGARDDVTLHAPKGMAIRGDTLFVSDIDSVRAFNRSTGAALGGRGVAGATFLNDLAVGPDGTLYVSDTGMDPDFEPTGTDAIYRFEGERAVPLARGSQLANPNGLHADADGVVVVSFGGRDVQRVAADGSITRIATLPAGQVDGIVRAQDGSYLVSSWEGKAVYRVHEGGHVEPVVSDVESPADIGYDSRRGRVLIPLFMGNRVEMRRVQ